MSVLGSDPSFFFALSIFYQPSVWHMWMRSLMNCWQETIPATLPCPVLRKGEYLIIFCPYYALSLECVSVVGFLSMYLADTWSTSNFFWTDGILNHLVHLTLGEVLWRMILRRKKRKKRMNSLLMTWMMVQTKRFTSLSFLLIVETHSTSFPLMSFGLNVVVILNYKQDHYRGRSPLRERDRDRERERDRDRDRDRRKRDSHRYR